MPDYDALIIGGGHNGLACACYLARAGLAVLVLEQYHTVGGMTITEELTLPGFQSDDHASGYQLANLSPAARELELAEHGVELIEPKLPYAHAFSDGRGLAVSRDLARTLENIGQFAARDAAAWQRLFTQYLASKDQLVASLFSPPPSLSAEVAAMEKTPGGLDAYRFSLQSLRSWCDENFESEEVKCLLG